jgi:hypothetical protein
MNRMRQLPVPLALVALAIGALAWSGPATAHDKAFDSRITIKSPESHIFKGRVFSDKPSCERNRTVKLYRKTTGQDPVAAVTETDDEGRWRIEFVGDRYYARVTRRVRERPGHRHVCLSDRSRVIEAGSTG